ARDKPPEQHVRFFVSMQRQNCPARWTHNGVNVLYWRLTDGSRVALCGIKPRVKDPMKKKLFITASVLIVAACSSKSDTMNDELKKDLDVAASSNDLSPTSNGQGQQVVSAIEQAPPAPKKIAASQRAVRHRKAETGTPA